MKRSSEYKVSSIGLRWVSIFIVLFAISALGGSATAGDSGKGFGFSIGFGNLPVRNFLYNTEADAELLPSEPEVWRALILTTGFTFNNRNSELTLDWFFTGSKRQQNLGTRPLVGGGRTSIARSLSHFGLFIGFREHVFYRLFANGGIGVISQSIDYSYGVLVENPGGGASEESSAWFWGLDVRVVDRLLFGFKIYRTQGYAEKALHGGLDKRSKAVTFHLSYL